MSDTFSETTQVGWFSRIGGAIKGLVFGIILFGISFPALFWNEGRAVAREKALDEGIASVISVDAAQIDSQNGGRLVHVAGRAETSDVLADPDFGVSISGLRLLRSVEMYQWDEKEKTETRQKLGGGEERVTTYSYEKKWSSDRIKSGEFRQPEDHVNPEQMPFSERTVQAETVTLGAFRLNASQIARAGSPRELPADAQILAPEAYAERSHRQNNVLYLGTDPATPVIGDTRVTFRLVPPGDVSLVAEQTGNTFTSFTTPSGGDIDLLEEGILPAARMFEIAKQENTVLTWILRAVGFFLMFFGLSLLFRPLSVLADVVPLFGRIVGAGTGIIAFLLALAGSLTTIAIAWIYYRPLIGIPLLIVAVGALMYSFLSIKRAPPAMKRTAAVT
ncbi:MAG: TMEM43 family protein [Pseudomonadota bacterium]|nr:TMEM43 family protein [Pseudomonadota bacterium]